MKKILFMHLPPAIEHVLREQLKDFTLLEIVSSQAGFSGDLVVTGENAATVTFPGCPVLSLTGKNPVRLGVVLQQISRMLTEPVLYASDIALGIYTLRPQEKILTRAEGADIALTDREVDILAYLARHPSKPVSREELLKNVWHYQDGVDTHTLETHIYRLRQKIEISAEEPRFLLTIEGGYALHLPETAV